MVWALAAVRRGAANTSVPSIRASMSPRSLERAVFDSSRASSSTRAAARSALRSVMTLIRPSLIDWGDAPSARATTASSAAAMRSP